jgi:hypothetical protein
MNNDSPDSTNGIATASPLTGESQSDTIEESTVGDTDTVIVQKAAFYLHNQSKTLFEYGDDDTDGTDDVESVSAGNSSSANNSSKKAAASVKNKNYSSDSERVYVDSGNSKKILLAMAYGLEDFGDVTLEPYTTATNRKSFTPTSDILKQEVKNRAILGGIKMPRPQGWNMLQLYGWLKDNPRTDVQDLLFLRQEVQSFANLLAAAKVEHTAEEELRCGREAWLGLEPFLRLYHVMLDDKIREAYGKINAVLNRTELDARNNENSPPSFYDLAADLFNNPSFNPTTSMYPELHEDFKYPIMLLHSDAPTPVTAQKIKEKLADSRAKLVVIIDNWERSGNGGGNRSIGDNDYGCVGEMTLQDDDRSNFLGGQKSHLLYFWSILEETQMLQKTLSIIPRDLSASSDGVPTTMGVINNKRKNKEDNENEEMENTLKFQKSMQASFSELATSSRVVAESAYQKQCTEAAGWYLQLHKSYGLEAEGDHKQQLKVMMDNAKKMYDTAKEKLSGK